MNVIYGYFDLVTFDKFYNISKEKKGLYEKFVAKSPSST